MLNKLAAVMLVLLGTATVTLASAVTQPPIPEPSVFALLASGAGAALLYARGRSRRK
jgi:hypothetical protein